MRISLFGPPTVEFCEKAGSGLIKRPYYAASNLAYLFAGVLILREGRSSRLSKLFGYSSIMIGVFSFIYDATHTYWSQLLDLLGMLIFINLLIYVSAKKPRLALQALAVGAGMFAIIYFRSFAGEFVFGVFILTEIILETRRWLRHETVKFHLWLKSLGIFILGFLIWLLDASQVFCDPHKFLKGRFIFHILTAISIYYLYKYFEAQKT